MPSGKNRKIGGGSGGLLKIGESERTTGLPALDSIKEEAAQTLAGTEFPTVRHEDWRFTNLAPAAAVPYGLPERNIRVAEKEFAGGIIGGLGGPALVFVNGVYAPALSTPPEISKNSVVCALSEAAKTCPEKIAGHLGKLSGRGSEFFTALNTAFFEDGAFVFIPGGVEEKTPVYLVYITDCRETARMCSPRNLIVAEDNCSAKIVEHYISVGDGVCLSNALSEVSIGSASAVEHYMLEFENKAGFNISTLNLRQQRDSRAISHSVLAGGAIVRNNVHPTLAGEGCDSLINGLFMPTGRQHMDNFMKVEHAAPHCDSRQLYNGVLNEKGRGVFHGRIIVHEGAAKTDAKQTNRNLLLSDTARIDTKPQLEIYNDDVKCTHGATIGQMDEDAVFYLRSRGIPESEARAVILRGFTGESIALMTVKPVRDFLEKESERWFDAALAN